MLKNCIWVVLLPILVLNQLDILLILILKLLFKILLDIENHNNYANMPNKFYIKEFKEPDLGKTKETILPLHLPINLPEV